LVLGDTAKAIVDEVKPRGSAVKITTMPKWMLIIAALAIIGGAITVYSTMGTFETALDPTQRNLTQLDGGDSVEVSLIGGYQYSTFRVEGTSNTDGDNHSISDSENVQIERVEPTILNGPRQGVNGTDYVAVGVYFPAESGNYSFENNAEAGDTIWLVNDTDYGSINSTIYLLQAGCCILFIGIALIPIAGIFIWSSSRAQAADTVVMMSAAGEQIPFEKSEEGKSQIPTTDQVWAAMHGGKKLQLSVAESSGVAPPFADSAEYIPEKAAVGVVVDDLMDTTSSEASRTPDDQDSPEQQRGWRSWDEG